ncbi:ABC transporter [Pseudocitrobacter faecalis]|uniref:ABC transporter n=1 Tax=Pseudocitrobacter faecalis TaxID=1398493 RepID=UPI003BA36D3C
MIRFLIIWGVFSVRNSAEYLHSIRRPFSNVGVFLLRKLMRHCPILVLTGIARVLCAFGLIGRPFRHQRAVATENYRCLTGKNGHINAAWIAVRRRLLEEAATWGQNSAVRQQIARCASELDAVVAPLHQKRIPVILAPLHCVSDVLAAMVGASVTPEKAGVIVSSSAELYDQQAREMGGIALSYYSIHQDSKALASGLTALLADVVKGEQNMILFPDISPDYTSQAEGALSAKLPCHLFGRAARLHNGIVRLAGAMSAQVVFYHLSYESTLQIHIHPPVNAGDTARVLPRVIEQTLQEHPHEWLLWHSHSLYFINH